MKVISSKICPFVQRVTATLEVKKIHYVAEYISLNNPPRWFIEVSPNKQVPILITDTGSALFESDAIIEYLDEISLPLQQNLSPEQRAINRAWSYQASKHYLIQCSAMQSTNEETLINRSANLTRIFERIEKALDSRPYFQSKKIGNVDIAWLVLLHRSAIVEEYSGYDFISAFPKIKRWQSKLLEATDLADRSVSDDFIEKFLEFYLSGITYLGKGKDCTTIALSSNEAKGCCR